MFFMLNHENQLIAADTEFLEEINAHTLYDASQRIYNKEIEFNDEESTFIYEKQNYSFSKTILTTLLGEIALYTAAHIENHSDIKKITNTSIDKNDTLPISEDQPNKDPHYPDTDEVVNLAIDNAEDLEDDFDIEAYNKTLDVNTEKIDIKIDEDKDIPIKEIGTVAGAGIILNELLVDDDTDDIPLEIETKDTSRESTLDDEVFSLASEEEEPTLFELKDEPTILEEEPSLLEEDTLPINDSKDSDKIETLDLQIHDTDTSSYDEIEKPIEAVPTYDSDTIIPTAPHSTLNTHELANLIGVTESEYTHFLADFHQESFNLEESLRNNDLKERHEAISILSEASLLLHLPHITEKLNELHNATSSEKDEVIDQYLDMVSSLDINFSSTNPSLNVENNIEENLDIKEKTQETIQEELKDNEMEAPLISVPIENEEKESFSLKDIKAIPFDFSIKEAAEELTLPVSLVSEFIIDFINQAEENIPLLYKAHQEEDLNQIQSIAHMLKGASSNLRITAMADTLYNLQFNDDLIEVPELIQLFSGQLKALSIQMNQTVIGD